MGHVRKVTANIPEDILENAQRLTGKGVTLTLVEGLRRSTEMRVVPPCAGFVAR